MASHRDLRNPQDIGKVFKQLKTLHPKKKAHEIVKMLEEYPIKNFAEYQTCLEKYGPAQEMDEKWETIQTK